MSFPKLFAFLVFCLFAAIAFMGWWRNGGISIEPPAAQSQEVTLETTIRFAKPSVLTPHLLKMASEKELPPNCDRIEELFRTDDRKLPIVQTVVYKSLVPWLKGRQAWLSDYASHYHTSRHFIARSLNGKPDYLKQDITEGARFNVWHPDVHMQLHLVIDVSLCKLWLYYLNLDNGEKVLLKSYVVGLGRPDSSSKSGLLTPTGTYVLGDKVATFTPSTIGLHQGQKTQLIRTFGTRWIPFERSIGVSSLPAKGYGIHGVPWKENEQGELVEESSSLGSYASDGCVRLSTSDMEEIFAIVITKPTVVELVPSFEEATFPVIDIACGI